MPRTERVLRPLTRTQVQQALEGAELIQDEILRQYGRGIGVTDIALVAATLLLRPTESVVIDVEYKQLTEEKGKDA